MPLKFSVGDTFPPAELSDHTGQPVTLNQVAGESPLILVFYRGPW